MDKSARNDVLAGILIFLVAAVFAAVTGEIFVDPQDPGFSARDFPIGVLTLVTVLAVALVARAVPKLARAGWRLYERGESRVVLTYVLPMVVIAFGYVWFNEMFQYPLPTALAAVLALAMFGNRNWPRLVAAPILATLIYYVLFYGLLGLHEAPGTVWEYDNQVFFRPMRNFLGLF